MAAGGNMNRLEILLYEVLLIKSGLSSEVASGSGVRHFCNGVVATTRSSIICGFIVHG